MTIAPRLRHPALIDALFRSFPDADKLKIYVRIVRLLLEEEDSVQAETYYKRAALLVHSSSDRETLLQFKLCQARISDYSRKFLEAASRYHELSYVGEIDEEERRHMLYVVPEDRRPYSQYLICIQVGSCDLRRPCPCRTESISRPRLALPRRAIC